MICFVVLCSVSHRIIFISFLFFINFCSFFLLDFLLISFSIGTSGSLPTNPNAFAYPRLNLILMDAFCICVFRLSISLKVFFPHSQFPIFCICSIAWYLLYKYLIWKRWNFGLISRKISFQMRTTPSRIKNKTTPKMATRIKEKKIWIN